MTGRAEPKYLDIRGEYVFDAAMLRDHLRGHETYAVTLALAGRARAGCRDYDNASQAEMLAALRKAAELGLCAFLILMPDATDGHQGGHLWCLFADDVPVSDICAALRRLPGGKGELYPSGSRIRLPFGYHKLKRTRGTLVLPSGERFNLDDPNELRRAIRVVLDLPRNPPPAPATEAERRSDAAWGDAYKPEHWQALPAGLPIWHSSRVATLARVRHRAQLGQLLRGERVTLMQNSAPDDSDSAQVACLVFHLMGASFPESEVRAVALALKDTLRPGRGLDHYRAHVDAEIARYRPHNYQPQATISAGLPAPAPAPLADAQHRRPRGRPVGSRAARCAALLRLLEALPADEHGRRSYHVDDLAAHLGCCRRTVSSLLAELEATGTLTRGAPRGTGGAPFLVFSWDANKSQEPCAAAPEAGTGDADARAFWDASNAAVPRIATPETAEINPMHRVYTPPVCPPAPPPARGRLGALVAEGFDAYGGAPLHTRKRLVLRYVADNGGADADPAFVDALYGTERDRRSMATWSTPRLRRSVRIYEVKADAARDGSGDLAWLWRRLHRDAAAELARRPAEPGRAPRAVFEALPNPRAAGARRQAELWAVVDAARARQRRGQNGGSVPPAPPEPPPAPIYDAAGLIARLYARQAPAAAAE
jgi:hypothetical protein